MFRFLFFLVAMMWVMHEGCFAQQGYDGPPIAITSPDAGTTFAFGSIKSHALYWSKKEKVLVVQVSFIDSHDDTAQANEDTHQFRLPGITFDEAKGIFYGTTAKGVLIPVAKIKKQLFFSGVEVLPNAHVRILHPRGQLSVILEAIPPNDPAMHPKPTDPDATQKVDINKLLN